MPSNHQNSLSIRDRFLQYGIYFFIFWYLLLCVVNYLNQRPLWNDEECVFLSVKSFNAKQMFTQELMSLQVFPRVYLFLIQQFSRLFDFHVLSLRFSSFLCMILAFFIWLKLAKYELKEKGKYLVFVLSWCASSMLIYYSSELKQYSMDVLAAAVYLLFIYNCKRLEQNNRFLFLIFLFALPFLGLFSYMAFLFPFILLYNFFIFKKENKEYIQYFLIFGCSLVAAIILSFFLDMRWRPSASVLFVDYFVSFESIGEFFKTWGEGTNNLFSRFFVEQPRVMKAVTRIFVGFGFFNMFYAFSSHFKKDGRAIISLNTVGFILYIELFILGALKVYPFSVPRTSLFFFPIILYLTIKGIALLSRIHIYLYRIFWGLYVIFLLFLTMALARLIFNGQSVFAPII